MALIDEYKQAIQDVLDGRMKPAPKPSELPWTEDKLATLWAAAAAEVLAEQAGGGGSSGGGVLVVTQDENGVLNKTWQEIHDAMAVGQIPVIGYVDGNDAGITIIGWGAFLNDVYALWGYGANLSQDDPWYSASSASGYPSAN